MRPHEESSWTLGVDLDDRRAALQGLPMEVRGQLRGALSGFLFDREAVAEELNLAATVSDSALLVAAYERHGRAAFGKLRGHFVAVIEDRAAGHVHLARDPLGHHPLFFARQAGAIFFAADLQTLFRAGVPRRFNRRVMADHLCHRWLDVAETFFEGVSRVPPGSTATIAAGRVVVARHWHPAPQGEPIRWVTDDVEPLFERAIDRAVDRCLSLGRAGIFLSGGLDSVATAAIAVDRAAHQRLPRPMALSLGFPTPECDETRVQRGVARDLNLEQILCPFGDAVGPRGLLAPALELNEGLWSPLINRWEPAYLHLADEGRRAGVEVILTGSGGDEWLTVTPSLSADLIRSLDVRSLAQFMGAWGRSSQQSSLRVMRNSLWRFGLRPLGGAAIYHTSPRTWRDRQLRRMLASDPSWVAPDASLRSEQRDAYETSLRPPGEPDGFYLQEVRSGVEHALMTMEREELCQMEQRAGVRFAHPFWDADLVDLLFRTPPARLVKDGRSKGLVRTTVARRFPEFGFERQQKLGATSFSRQLFRAEGPGLVDGMGALRTLGELGVIDADAARTFMQTALQDNRADLFRVWDVLNLEKWARLQVN